MRMCAQYRNTTNSNGNQVCPAFCRIQWERTSFVRYEDIVVDRPPTITKCSDDPRRDTCSVHPHREIHGSFMVTYRYLLTSTFPSCMMSFLSFSIGWWDVILQVQDVSFLKVMEVKWSLFNLFFRMVFILGLRNESCSQLPLSVWTDGRHANL